MRSGWAACVAQRRERALDLGAVAARARRLQAVDLLAFQGGVHAQGGDRLLVLLHVAVDADHDALAGVDLALQLEGGVGDLALGEVAT